MVLLWLKSMRKLFIVKETIDCLEIGLVCIGQIKFMNRNSVVIMNFLVEFNRFNYWAVLQYAFRATVDQLFIRMYLKN